MVWRLNNKKGKKIEDLERKHARFMNIQFSCVYIQSILNFFLTFFFQDLGFRV